MNKAIETLAIVGLGAYAISKFFNSRTDTLTDVTSIRTESREDIKQIKQENKTDRTNIRWNAIEDIFNRNNNKSSSSSSSSKGLKSIPQGTSKASQGITLVKATSPKSALGISARYTDVKYNSPLMTIAKASNTNKVLKQTEKENKKNNFSKIASFIAPLPTLAIKKLKSVRGN